PSLIYGRILSYSPVRWILYCSSSSAISFSRNFRSAILFMFCFSLSIPFPLFRESISHLSGKRNMDRISDPVFFFLSLIVHLFVQILLQTVSEISDSETIFRGFPGQFSLRPLLQMNRNAVHFFQLTH